MKSHVSIVTRKGQVTIPAEVRRSLGLQRGDRVAFVIEDSRVSIIPRASVTQRTAAMFRSGRPSRTAEQLRKEAETAIGTEAAQR